MHNFQHDISCAGLMYDKDVYETYSWTWDGNIKLQHQNETEIFHEWNQVVHNWDYISRKFIQQQKLFHHYTLQHLSFIMVSRQELKVYAQIRQGLKVHTQTKLAYHAQNKSNQTAHNSAKVVQIRSPYPDPNLHVQITSKI